MFSRKYLLTILLTLSVSAFAKPTTPMVDASPLDEIAAVVNDGIITKSELLEEVETVIAQMQQNNETPQKTLLEKQVLEHLITKKIQLQTAKISGIQVDDAQLEKTIKKMAAGNGMDVPAFQKAVVNASGMDFKNYREKLREQVTISQLRERDLLPNIQISEQEVTQFLNSPNGFGNMRTEYHLAHILIGLPASPSPEEVEAANKKVNELFAKLEKGEDFTQVALHHSQGEQALQGGDLGWRKAAEIPTLFEKVAPTLKEQEITSPIRSDSGFHIVKLLGKRNAADLEATEKNAGTTYLD